MFSPFDGVTSHSVLELIKCGNINSYDHSFNIIIELCYLHGTVSDTGEEMMNKTDVFFIQETFLVSITFSPVGAKKEGKRVLKHLPREKNF